jgi:hypothetical protein
LHETGVQEKFCRAQIIGAKNKRLSHMARHRVLLKTRYVQSACTANLVDLDSRQDVKALSSGTCMLNKRTLLLGKSKSLYLVFNRGTTSSRQSRSVRRPKTIKREAKPHKLADQRM